MVFIRPGDRRMLRVSALKQLNSSAGSDVRVEFITRTGGTKDLATRQYIDATITYAHQDVRALVLPVTRPNLEQIGELFSGEEVRMFQFDPKVNFARKENLTFWLNDITKSETGDGTGSGKTWTVSGADWTADEWKGYSLLVDGDRWKIASNSTTELTVEERTDLTLPSSGSYQILNLQPWYPIKTGHGVQDGSQYVIGSHRLFQVFIVSSLQGRGQQVAVSSTEESSTSDTVQFEESQFDSVQFE